MKIGILGAGAYGSAMSGVLRDNGHKVKLFANAKVLPTTGLKNW